MSVTFTYDETTATLPEYAKGDTDIFNNALRFVVTRAALVRTYRKSVKRKRTLSFSSVLRSEYNKLLALVEVSYSAPVVFTDRDSTTANVYIRATLTATHSGKITGVNPDDERLTSDPSGQAYVDFQLEVIYA